jgi:hypothetical protein
MAGRFDNGHLHKKLGSATETFIQNKGTLLQNAGDGKIH